MLKCPETQTCREQPLNTKLPHTNEILALRKILRGQNIIELRTLGNLVSEFKCKWDIQLKRAELRLWESQNAIVHRIVRLQILI